MTDWERKRGMGVNEREGRRGMNDRRGEEREGRTEGVKKIRKEMNE